MDEKPIYFGGAIKALENGQVEGYLVRFTDDNVRDLHGQYFTRSTDFHIPEGYVVKGERTMYQHGLDMKMGVKRIGQVVDMKIDDIGMWIQAQIDLNNEYNRAVYDLAKDGRLSWSSGALPQSVEVDDDGQIKSWAIIEASLTPTPAQPFLTKISTHKSLAELSLLEGASQRAGSKATLDGDNDRTSNEGSEVKLDSETPNKDEKTMDKEMIRQIVAELLAEMGVKAGGAEEAAGIAVMEEEAKAIPENAKPEELEEKMKSIARAAGKAIQAEVVKRKDAAKSIAAGAVADLRSAPGKSIVYETGIQSGKPQTRVEVGDNLKYAHLSATDMALAWKMAVSASPFGQLPTGMDGRRATEFVSEEFYRNAVYKMAAEMERANFKRAEDALFVKSVTPWKANELDATDITGQGLEYLGNVYDTMVWETARNNQIYQLMQKRGMLEKQVPQGMESTIVPVEGSDPSVYGGIEANSTDSTGRPEVVYKITPMTTSTITVTPGTFRTATAYTFKLGEDSFVNMATEANRKVRLALEEHIEKAMINADTATAANTNINDIAGTPTANGLTRDYFLEFNGLRKSPLVTSTAYSRSGGTLAIDDYRRTWALLGSTQAPRKENIFFLIDFDTFQASLDLLPTLTKDVAGERAGLFTGEFQDLWGIPVYMSGFLALSNSAGKIDQDVTANNTKGQILAVYAPYWAFTFKRNITIEMQRNPQSETFEFYGSMRFSLTRRSASASAITYNLTI